LGGGTPHLPLKKEREFMIDGVFRSRREIPCYGRVEVSVTKLWGSV